MQSRYYNPEIGRFISADDYVSTGLGLLNKNMFTYCLNNPVNYIDKSGTTPVFLFIGIISLVAVVVVGLDHILAATQPKGGYALANETRDNGTNKKGLYAEGSGFEIDENGVTLCDTEVGLASFSIENEYMDFEVVDCLTASATAELDWSGMPSMDVSAVAAIYSPSIEFVLPIGAFNITITAELLVGAVGIGAELDTDSGKFKITPPTLGLGGSFSVDFDLIG